MRLTLAWRRAGAYHLCMKIRRGIRLFLLALAGAYLAFMTASHSTPFSPDLEAPLALAGWLPLAAGVVIIGVKSKGSTRRKPHYAALRQYLTPMRGRRDVLLFGVVLLVVLAAAATEASLGNRDESCQTNDPAACIKIDQWAEKDGSYFRKYPYDAAGADDPNAPWVQISRAEYVAEVGTRLRSAAGFGLLALALAGFLSVVEEGMSLTRRARKGELGLSDDLPQPG